MHLTSPKLFRHPPVALPSFPTPLGAGLGPAPPSGKPRAERQLILCTDTGTVLIPRKRGGENMNDDSDMRELLAELSDLMGFPVGTYVEDFTALFSWREVKLIIQKLNK